MRRTDVIIIGGGQAGLAMSRCLADRQIDHVILERGRVAERWRSERWESLRLLTPNWQSRLPGYRYEGADPDGYMSMSDVVAYLEGYARSFNPPIQTRTSVLAVERDGSGFRVVTDGGEWKAPNVVVATGYCDLPSVPTYATRLPEGIVQLVPTEYRNPQQLPQGGVLIIGAASSGIQLADEILESGRPVTLAVGRHTRLPRRYRGRDILWWLDRMGVLDEREDQVYDIALSRRQPSLQLVGRSDRRSLDLPGLQNRGVRLTGRALGVSGGTVEFDDDLVAHTAAADARLARLLERVDRFIEQTGIEAARTPEDEFVPFFWPCDPPGRIDLRAEGIRTVIWATGFRRSYPWLRVPVLDARGEILHDGGITPEAGLYVMGLQFLRRRKSSFIDGVGDDARDLAAHIEGRLRRRPAVA